ncbi:hypothetical protein CL645_00425 [bacterium]|nr:hypothetical protein [bacterium]|tara:strand:+ start:981 stop:1379 length:399 start_codon:yes stop_codon:yes gene_type:complete
MCTKKVEFDKEKPFDSIYELFAYLRGPQGCPWDKEQDFDNYLTYLKSEIHELESSKKKSEKIEESLDVFFNALMLLICIEDEEDMPISKQLSLLHKKYVKRHPHVFGDKKASTPEDVVKIWRDVKRKERVDR